MALIGKIRRNSWLLVFLLALGLIGFIMMDMTSGQTSVFGSDAATMATIDGRKLSINEFNRTEQLLYRGGGGDTYSQREFLWNYYVDETLMKKEADALGLGISKDELIDLQFGTNVSPIIQQRFRDPNTFQVDRARLNEFKRQIDENEMTDPSIRGFWAHQEKEIQTDRLKTKIGNLVSKAMYAPSWMAEMASNDQYATVDFAYVQVPFDAIDNSEVTLDDNDFQAYLNTNKARYMQDEETRRIEYTTFNVSPTAQDSADIFKQMQELAADFRTIDNDTVFVETNYGTFDHTYKKKAELDASISDTIFRMPVGSVYGPYLKDGAYEIAKVLDRKIIPDSVQARHILISAQNDPQQFFNARRTIDSLKNLIETGAERFDSLAVKFSQDPGSGAKGGMLDYAAPGAMVKPFNDVLFYSGEPGNLYTVGSQFGVHLIEIMGRNYESNESGAQVQFLREVIVPSEDTQNALYQKALEFTSTNKTRESMLAAVAADDNLEVESSQALKANDFNMGTLGTGESSRQMVRWAFGPNASVDAVSPDVYIYQDEVNYYNNKYVIASLKSIQPAGMPTVAGVRDDIEPQVINMKKTDMILAAVQGKDMNGIASQYSTSIDTTKSANFNSTFLAGLGNEPKVVARAMQMAQGDTSEPIRGENGVYVIKVVNKPKNITPANIAQMRQTISQSTKAQIPILLPQQLRETANVEDNRSRFY